MAASAVWEVEVGRLPNAVIIYELCMYGKPITLPVMWKDQIFHLELADACSYCGAEEHNNASTCPLKIMLNLARQHDQANTHIIWNLEPKTITSNQGPSNTTNMNVGQSGTSNNFSNNSTNTNMRPWQNRRGGSRGCKRPNTFNRGTH
ncbi:hypothetical protein O181_032885 [Austropuccinia psidii MF-1]|uniref:Uncharacterized protein n=1 Tax=Austropuccinia psidii MF-1 TaxID=1389203 RepID=A0A9Q3D0E2_9BASI|nr:hypothetical protein [Austropuccinia psidii MF-1]